MPFTLLETEQYLQSRGHFYDRYQIVQLYMAIGGIPHYLKEIDASESVVQNLDTLCSTIPNELMQSGFVAEIYPFGKSQKDKLYRLDDEYSLFYLQFIEKNRQHGRNLWQHLSQTPAYKAWSVFAFEGVCLKHTDQIKQALSIAGIFSTVSSFYQKGTSEEDGAQIDMVLDRNDHTVNLFEIKFYNQPFTLTKNYAEQLRQKCGDFKAERRQKNTSIGYL